MGIQKRILVLDDELMVRKVLMRLLASFGHVVSGASGGTEALGAFDSALGRHQESDHQDRDHQDRDLEANLQAALECSADEPLRCSDSHAAPVQSANCGSARSVAGTCGPIELLIADVSLQGEDGRAIAAQLRRRDPQLRVLFVSGGRNEPSPVDDAGRTAYLSKPFSGSQLRGALSDLFRGTN